MKNGVIFALGLTHDNTTVEDTVGESRQGCVCEDILLFMKYVPE